MWSVKRVLNKWLYRLLLLKYAAMPSFEILKQESLGEIEIEQFLDDNVYDNFFNSQGQIAILTPPEITEETLDIANVPTEEIIPLCPSGPPARTVFAGSLNFSVEINALDTHRKKYLYSHKLNRIYVDIKTNFAVQFRWNFAAAGPMFVRATTVFSDESQAEKRVERCLQHLHESANAGLHPTIVKNVLHSSRDFGTPGVFYCGEPSYPDSWYSVLLQFDGRTADAYSHAYQFVCKNSCASGINRRAIDIIFTLEDQAGQVYGRQLVGARVCSCTRRDKLRDEQQEAKERPTKRRVKPAPQRQASDCKKIKLEADNDVVVLPPLQIVGRKTMITGLEVMLSTMEQLAAAKRHDPQAAQLYLAPIDNLRTTIEELKNNPPNE